MINNFESEFHLIANKTHPTHYQVYSNELSLFYGKLMSFYDEYPIKLDDLLSGLFLNITLSFFNFNNDNHKFDIQCVEENIKKFNLFDTLQLKNIERKLISSLETFKLFSNGLTRARDMMIEFYSKFEKPNDECKKQLAKMNACIFNNVFRGSSNLLPILIFERSLFDLISIEFNAFSMLNDEI